MYWAKDSNPGMEKQKVETYLAERSENISYWAYWAVVGVWNVTWLNFRTLQSPHENNLKICVIEGCENV